MLNYQRVDFTLVFRDDCTYIIIYPNFWKLKNPMVVDVILINSLNYTCIPQGAHRFLDLILLHCSVK
jgi:hypothetical protein